MIPEIGQLVLLFALIFCFILCSLPVLGVYRPAYGAWQQASRPLTYIVFGFVVVAFICLVISFVRNDFSVAYVAGHSNSFLPTYYKVSAVWGGHEGSLLLWLMILTGWMAAVAYYSRSLPQVMVVWVLAVMAIIAIGFLLFVLLTSNPFDRLLPQFPLDGQDLNPLLQDFGLIVHPPMLYMGYVGFSVAFAFAIAGLIQGHLDVRWAQWTRPWALLAWGFLTAGIALGSWWAYYELGWGGWWFWDPVENASFLPWLTGTALLHSLIVAEKRNTFKAWTILLAILAFSLSLLGTFLVRSGVLTSVHAFANDPERGLFILIFLCVVVGGSLTLFAWRAQHLKSDVGYQRLSREALLLTNNIILMTATLVVLLGTLFPLISEALGMGKLSVGPPYFNALFVPLTWLLLCVLGIGPLVHWRRYDAHALWHRVRWMLPLAAVLGLLVTYIHWRELDWPVVVSIALVFWVLLLLIGDIRKGVGKRSWRYWGMCSAHLGVLVMVVGVAYTQYYSVEQDVRLAVGESAAFNRGATELSFEFVEVKQIEGPNYSAYRGHFRVMEQQRLIAELYPEKRNYWIARNVMTEAAIQPGLFRDLYVALGEPLNDAADEWAVRLYAKPYVRWIWLGSIFMVMGSLLALFKPAQKRSLI